MTSTSVAIVDYGMGNLRSVAQAVLHAAQGLPVSVAVTSQPQAVRDAARVILPGQGAMGDCMAALQASGLQEAVLQAAASKPLLGICVGMQMLLEHSAEGHTAAGTPGLALLPGEVLKFDFAGRRAPDGSACKVPQMGWNRVRPCTHSGGTRFGKACATCPRRARAGPPGPKKRMAAIRGSTSFTATTPAAPAPKT